MKIILHLKCENSLGLKKTIIFPVWFGGTETPWRSPKEPSQNLSRDYYLQP